MKRDTPLNEYIAPLRRALRRLKEEQTDGRRRAARKRVKAACGNILYALDMAFPAPKRKVAAKRSTRAKVAGHLQEIAPVAVPKYSKAAAVYGVRMKARKLPERYLMNGAVAPAETRYYLPKWFVAAFDSGATATQISEAKKSPSLRKAILGKAALLNAARILT